MNRFISFQVFNGKEFLNVTTIVYLKLLECADPINLKIVLNGDRIDEICSLCDISRTSFYRALKLLVQQNVISYNGGTATLLDCQSIKKSLKEPFVME